MSLVTSIIPFYEAQQDAPAYVADRRLYLVADGTVVEADDPDRLTLLVAKGGRLSLNTARRYGLLAESERTEPAADSKAVRRRSTK